MIYKLLGSVFIIIGILGVGMGISSGARFRIDNLKSLKHDLNILLSEILHNRSTFANAISSINSELSIVYKEILTGLSNNNSVQSSWAYSFNKYREKLYFTKNDVENIKQIGQIFSSPDYTYQKNELTAYIDELERNIEGLEEKYKKDIRLYRSIYTSAAALIVVLLF